MNCTESMDKDRLYNTVVLKKRRTRSDYICVWRTEQGMNYCVKRCDFYIAACKVVSFPHVDRIKCSNNNSCESVWSCLATVYYVYIVYVAKWKGKGINYNCTPTQKLCFLFRQPPSRSVYRLVTVILSSSSSGDTFLEKVGRHLRTFIIYFVNIAYL